MKATSYQEIYEVVSRIPAGRVATYGQVARLAGIPGHARQVGYALSALDDHSTVPWQRVVNARGMISPRSGDNSMELVQRLLLEAEGVKFEGDGRISLARFQWRPGDGIG
ncbi:MAG TPA: MGMT family protein [Geobacteraceae bacterium]